MGSGPPWSGSSPTKLGQEVRIILPREDGTHYRACPHCEHELDVDQGEWVADFPDRAIHGYRISQLFSSKMDPGEILEEYRTSLYPERFYNLKIGIPWADLERRVDPASVLALRGHVTPWEEGRHSSAMGVDTGKNLHVVVLRKDAQRRGYLELIDLGVCQSFEDLDYYMDRFRVWKCVIDGQPETHATKEFAKRWRSRVYMNFFTESRGTSPKWNRKERILTENRTEALDASRAVIRDKKLLISSQIPYLKEFAQHMSCDAKVLDEDPETGAKKYRYVRTGENHFSMAFTYAYLASTKPQPCVA